MKRILKHELYKLFNSLTLKILAMVMVFFAILYVLSAIVMNNASLPQMMRGYFASNGLGGALQSFMDISDLSIYIAVIVSLIVVYDINSQTIKNTMICDISRGKIFFAKFITEIIGVTIIMAINIIIQTGILTLCLGWGETFTFESFFENFIVISLMGMILCYAMTAFINFFADLTKNIVIVIVIVFFVTLILSIITILNASIDSSILDFINKLSITSVLTNYNSDKTFENVIYYVISVSLLFFPFIIGGYLYFKKQEIK